ncbi:MAG: FkbM family methyltransferase [Bacteroidota bacterium]|nr:FkbM family methyltransferase [Bacteroidota bacterium]
MNKPFSFYLMFKIPYLRGWYFKYRTNWIDKNQNAEIETRIINHIKVFLTLKDWVQRNLFIYGYYELAETGFWINLVENKKVVFDIGANIGYYSLLASKNMDDNALIYAFEPIHKTYSRAKYNIELNGFKNILLNKLALSAQDGYLEINVGNDENWGMSSITKHNYLSEKTERVESQKLDTFVLKNKITEIDLIKIDVEGSEYFVLKGMQVTLQQFRPVVLIEVLDEHLMNANTSKEEIFNLFWKQQYKAYKILNSTELVELPEPVSYDGLICFHPNEKPFDQFIRVNS